MKNLICLLNLKKEQETLKLIQVNQPKSEIMNKLIKNQQTTQKKLPNKLNKKQMNSLNNMEILSLMKNSQLQFPIYKMLLMNHHQVANLLKLQYRLQNSLLLQLKPSVNKLKIFKNKLQNVIKLLLKEYKTLRMQLKH